MGDFDAMNEILTQVRDVIVLARQGAYGDPSVQHQVTADQFRAYVKAKYGLDIPFDGEDTCVFNIHQKLARHACGAPKKDTPADIIGYGANLWACMEDARP